MMRAMNQASHKQTHELKVGARERFMQAYANVPLNVRKEIIATLDEVGPVTWDVAYLEIKNKTEKGNEILTTLETTGWF